MARQESLISIYRITEWLVFMLFMALVGWTTAALMPSVKAEKAPVQRRLDDWAVRRPTIDLTKLEEEIRSGELRELQRKKLELIDRVIIILEKLEASDGLR